MILPNYKLKFPKLKDIKSCKRHPNPKDKDEYKEYKWIIFTLNALNTYCRITYNEDDNGKIFLDMMQNGYCDRCRVPGFNKVYPATKEGYEELINVCEREYNRLITELLGSNNYESTLWRFGDDN